MNPKWLYTVALMLLGLSVRWLIEDAEGKGWNEGFNWGKALRPNSGTNYTERELRNQVHHGHPGNCNSVCTTDT